MWLQKWNESKKKKKTQRKWVTKYTRLPRKERGNVHTKECKRIINECSMNHAK